VAERSGTIGWYWSFVIILVLPLVTVPLTSWMQSTLVSPACTLTYSAEWGFFRCPTGLVLPTLWPGLLNLLPLRWARSSPARLRIAARVAGGLGIARLLAAIGYHMRAGETTILTLGLMSSAEAIVLSGGLWVVSALVTGLCWVKWHAASKLLP
jgi:hypothetical protein